jgi:hypothetical protein
MLLGGLEQARTISLTSFSPSKIRANAGVTRCLRLNTASKPSSTSCFRTRQTMEVVPAFTGLRDIGLQQDPRLQQPPCRVHDGMRQMSIVISLVGWEQQISAFPSLGCSSGSGR